MPDSTATAATRAPGLAWVAWAAALAAIVPGAGALLGPFLFDDLTLIAGNHFVHSLEHWQRWFVSGLWDSNFDPAASQATRGFFRPFAVASYALDWQWSGGRAWGFHLTNVLIHAINAGLLARVLMGWRLTAWGVSVGALAFAIHPVQTEPVAWISGRTDSLCALGLLLATLALRQAIFGKKWAYGACVLGLILAAGSKEAFVVFPALFGIELWARDGLPLSLPRVVRLLLAVLPWLGLALAYVGFHLGWVEQGHTNSPPLAERAPLILEAFGRYAGLLLWPDDLTLGRALIRYESGRVAAHPGFAVGGVGAVAALLWVAWSQRLRAPTLALGALSTLVLLVPVCGFVWLGYFVLVSPRFLYIPMIGVALALGAAFGGPRLDGAQAQGVRPRVGAALALPLGLVFAWSGCSFLRSLDYRSAEAFWRSELTATPMYPSAQQYFLARELSARRPASALRLAQSWLQQSVRAGRPERERAALLHRIVSALIALCPDGRRVSLAALGDFSESLARGRPARLEMSELGLVLEVEDSSALQAGLRLRVRQLWLIAAEAAARLGQERLARARLAFGLEDCERCWTLQASAARVLAHIRDPEAAWAAARRAQRWGPRGFAEELLAELDAARHLGVRMAASPSPVARAQYFAAVGAFGRAYDAAAPAIADPPSHPGALARLAQLAYLAGDTPQARALLERAWPAEQVQAQFVELARLARWHDAPTPPSVWLPPSVRPPASWR